MGEEREEQSEVEAKWGDKSIRAKSKYMSELIAFSCLVLLILTTYGGYLHLMDTRERDRQLIEVMRNSDHDLRDTLREFTQTQKEMVAAQREQNCLIALPPDMRQERIALCRSTGR